MREKFEYNILTWFAVYKKKCCSNLLFSLGDEEDMNMSKVE